MRTSDELSAERHTEAHSADFVVLVVGFPAESKFVSSALPHDEAAQELNALVERGGYPLGFIRSTKRKDRQIVDARPLAEYANDPVPGRVLQQIRTLMADESGRRYGVYAKRNKPSSEE